MPFREVVAGWVPACAEMAGVKVDSRLRGNDARGWVPACAGMTCVRLDSRLCGNDVCAAGFPPARE